MNDITLPVNETYRFTLTGKTSKNYGLAYKISQWLVTNLSGLLDDDNNVIFSKVNTGFNENSLKTFSGKPTCDVYINNIEYSTDFDESRPATVNTIVLFYFKGANNHAYMKACELHDYIMQEFITNPDFQELEGIVQNTYIKNSELMTQPINKKWGVMGAFELSHITF